MANVTGQKPQEMSAKPVRIAVVPGDGIGREVVAEAMFLADALGDAIGFVVRAGEATHDFGGRCTTSEAGRAVRERPPERLAA